MNRVRISAKDIKYASALRFLCLREVKQRQKKVLLPRGYQLQPVHSGHYSQYCGNLYVAFFRLEFCVVLPLVTFRESLHAPNTFSTWYSDKPMMTDGPEFFFYLSSYMPTTLSSRDGRNDRWTLPVHIKTRSKKLISSSLWKKNVNFISKLNF